MIKIKFALVIILILASIEIYNIKKPRIIFEGLDRVAQIALYHLGTRESVYINNEDDINYYINMFNKIRFNKGKYVGNASTTGLMVILYDEDGGNKGTLVLSEDTLIQRRRELNIIDGENPYNELMRVFESRLLKNTL